MADEFMKNTIMFCTKPPPTLRGRSHRPIEACEGRCVTLSGRSGILLSVAKRSERRLCQRVSYDSAQISVRPVAFVRTTCEGRL